MSVVIVIIKKSSDQLLAIIITVPVFLGTFCMAPHKWVPELFDIEIWWWHALETWKGWIWEWGVWCGEVWSGGVLVGCEEW